MAYDETTHRRSADEYRGRRRDDDPASRHAETSAGPARRTTAAADDGRDRLGVHVGWEIALLLVVAAVGYLLFRLDPASLRRPALDTLLVSGTVVGLLTLGAGLTLRAGVPNLAVGPIALAAALHYAENGDRGLIDSAWPALAIAAIGGLVVALLVVGLHVPGWAATLAAALGVVVLIRSRTAPVTVQGGYDPADQAFYLFGGFALLAVVGGALGTVGAIRRALGRLRAAGDPAARRGAGVVLPVVGSLVLSSVFAVVAGFLLAAQSTGPVVPGPGLEWTGVAIGTAMLAGTSAYGRRGGVFGTLLAVAGVVLFLDYAARRDLDVALYAVAAGTVAAGLVVTRVVETYGRPLPGTDEDWTAAAPSGAPSWSLGLPATFTVPAEQHTDRWDDGPWRATR